MNALPAQYYMYTDAVSTFPWTSLVFHCVGTGNPRIFCAKLNPSVVSSSSGDDDSGDDDGVDSAWQIWGIISIVLVSFLVIVVFYYAYNKPAKQEPLINDSKLGTSSA